MILYYIDFLYNIFYFIVIVTAKMFGNGRSDYVSNIFEHKIEKSELCDYCNVKNADVAFYVQTPSYYRNKASGDYFMCSQECHQKFRLEKRCNRCGYADDLILTDKGYSLCTNYPHDVSCYNKEYPPIVEQVEQINQVEHVCNFCRKLVNIWTSRKIDDKETLYTCDACDKIYENIVLWNIDEITYRCIFCDYEDRRNVYHEIKRCGSDIKMCDRCYVNYNKLTGYNNDNNNNTHTSAILRYDGDGSDLFKCHTDNASKYS